jgi:hypothetical protein
MVLHGRVLRVLLALCFALAIAAPIHGAGSVYQTSFIRWRAAEGGFSAWQRAGVDLTADGRLQLAPASAATETDPYAAGTYYGHNFYTGGTYLVGEATSPEVAAAFNFREAIASWNAETPAGTWIETLIRVNLSGRWTTWYNAGPRGTTWASGPAIRQRSRGIRCGSRVTPMATSRLIRWF